jgi:peptidoglycan DL-endopeptidase CwlO
VSKKLLSVFLSFLLLLSTSTIAYANNTPQDNISQNKIKFQLLNDKIIELRDEISTLNAEILKVEAAIEKNDNDISKIEDQIEIAEVEKKVLTDELEEKQKLAGQRLRALYIASDKGNYLSVILTSKSISDFFYKVEAVRKIASFDKKLFRDVEIKKEALENTITNLEINKFQLQTLKNENSTSLQKLNDDKVELQSAIQKFDEEKKAAASVIAENEEKLVAHSISVIKSSSATSSTLRSALNNLRSLLPHLNTPSVRGKVEQAIRDGDIKLASMSSNASRPSTNPSRGPETYKATYTMTATAYAIHGYTATGIRTVRDPNGISTIAVDPRVIPLGTKVYIPGYGYAIAADTGGAIKGYKIDIFLNTVAECIQWGRRNVTLHVIAYPGEW